MKRIFGMIGIAVGFFWTLTMLGFVLYATENKVVLYSLFAGGVICFVGSIMLFRSGKPIEFQPESVKEVEEFNKLLPSHHYYTAVAVSFILTAVYAALYFTKNISLTPTAEELYKVGAGYGADAAHGQPWRLFTQIFLHGSVAHLLSNIVGLIAAGKILDYLVGRKNFLAVFLVGGLFASICSSVWNPTVVCVGASGAVFAIYGAIFSSYFFSSKMKDLKIPKGVWLGSAFQAFNSISYGLSHAGIDNAAHIGGLVGGFIFMAAIYKTQSGAQDRSFYVFRGAAALMVVFAFTAMPGIIKQSSQNPVSISQNLNGMIAAMESVEALEKQYREQMQPASGEDQASKLELGAAKFLPQYRDAIEKLKLASAVGVPDQVIALRDVLHGSASACADLYSLAIRANRNPASVGNEEADRVSKACTEKMQLRAEMVNKIAASQK